MSYISEVLNQIKTKDLHEVEFMQALEEVLTSVAVVFKRHPEYQDKAVIERLVEPERIIQFKVSWEDDQGKIHVNRGFRIQFNSALGPYKGGLRFNPNVNLSVMKFLGFEQTFKNALTGLPIGGGKGGSDFNPKGRSNAEIKRFCVSFMNELYRHIGPDVDVPAGDMGVGAVEIGYMYGQYRRITGTSQRGVLTGKGLTYGGSLVRKEATGYGVIYFLNEVMIRFNMKLEGRRIVVSGSGNVAVYTAEKAMAHLGKVIAMSDSTGYIIDENLDLLTVKYLKEDMKSSLSEYPKLAGRGEYYQGSIYDHQGLQYDIAIPCATQNEIDLNRARNIYDSGCKIVIEGANMPNNNEAIDFYKEHHVIFVPGKAANAGGVATSALEMSQNSMRYSWTFEEVDNKLKSIMSNIHDQCVKAIIEYELEEIDYVTGANIAAIKLVIDAMLAQGDY